MHYKKVANRGSHTRLNTHIINYIVNSVKIFVRPSGSKTLRKLTRRSTLSDKYVAYPN